MEPLYLSADEIRPGDMLPDVSRWPVIATGRTPDDPASAIVLKFGGGYVRVVQPAIWEPDNRVSYAAFRVERPTCPHPPERTIYLDADTNECLACGETWGSES